MSKKLFITGTGTDVGKTYVTGLIIKKLKEHGIRAAYYKAAMSGNKRDEKGGLTAGDAWHVKQVSRLEGNPVQMEAVKKGFEEACSKYDYVTMEGSGGILCPICMGETEIWLEDIIRELGLSSLIVADAGLGAINSVVLTAAYMKAQNLPIKGIIFNHFHPGNVMEEDNLRMCQYRTGLPVVACIEEGGGKIDIDIDLLTALYEE